MLQTVGGSGTGSGAGTGSAGPGGVSASGVRHLQCWFFKRRSYSLNMFCFRLESRAHRTADLVRAPEVDQLRSTPSPVKQRRPARVMEAASENKLAMLADLFCILL